MKIVVLGSGAGGGVPQWNCNCKVCQLARAGTGEVIPRTQSSIAVSVDGEHWTVFNCSPDIRQQILDTSALWPADDQYRHTPIQSVVLTNADVDHLCGLLILREKQAFSVFATKTVLSVLDENPLFNVLDSQFVSRSALHDHEVTAVGEGLFVEPFLVPGKVALFNEERMLEQENSLQIGEETEHTIGLRIFSAEGAESFFYVPGCAEMTGPLAERLKGAPLVLFDGTVWFDSEMVSGKLGAKTGQRMGHMSMNGEHGSIAAFAPLEVERKVFIHINNSNRVLMEHSDERNAANAAGWEIAYDGMAIEL
ncbi:MAG: pyrroloquinoline quinone biosynthesis protein PqqB [Alphaproteobacteria bacterium]|nr:pyrroloquinoline quinone biosynthesis protein PqqB [Alphaproteobacteria bacterium]